MKFLDTNIVVYAHSTDPQKADVAQSLIDPDAAVSVQVLNEFVAVSLRKTSMTLPTLAAQTRLIASICTVVPLTEATHDKALAIAERHQLHIYDANIWAAAILAGCDTLYSEDMHAGLTIEGVRLTDPFVA